MVLDLWMRRSSGESRYPSGVFVPNEELILPVVDRSRIICGVSALGFGVSRAGAGLTDSLADAGAGAGESRASLPAFCRSNRSLTRFSASITRARFSSLLIPPKATSSFCRGDRSEAQSCRRSLVERVVSDRLNGDACWVLTSICDEPSRALSSCGTAGCGNGRLLGVVYSFPVGSGSGSGSGSGGSGLSSQFGGTFLDLAENELGERWCPRAVGAGYLL